MKKAFSVILSLAALAVFISAQPPAKNTWQEFASEKENFKVMLPAQPRESTELVESEIGRIPIHSFASQAAPNYFTVMVAEYPMSFDTEEAAKGVVEAGVGAMISKMKLEKVDQKEFAFDKYPGLEVRAQIMAGVMTMRAFVVKNRMYMLIALIDNTSLKLPNPIEVSRFFDSFKFHQPPDSIMVAASPVSGIGAEKEADLSGLLSEPLLWRDFRQPDYGFTVRMPREPKKETVKVNPNDPRLDMHNWLAIGENGLVYLVAFQQLLAVPENDYNTRIYIENLRDGLVKGIGGKIVSERQIAYNGHPGREFKITSEKVEGFGRLYLIGSRVFILCIISGVEEVDRKAADDYFNSLVVAVIPNTVSTTAGTVVETATWKDMAEPKLGFKVTMPAAPVRETRNVEDLKIEMLSSAGDGVFCLAGHMFVPGPKPSKQELTQLFKNFGGGFASSIKATVTAEKEISLDGYPGRELALKNDLVSGVCRLYMVNGHLYILITIPTLGGNADGTMAKFLDSFKLTKLEFADNDQPPPPPPPPMPKSVAEGKEGQPAPKKIKVSGGVLQAGAIKRPQPGYPKEAKKARVQGEVQIQIVVSEEGKVIDTQVISGPEELREVALEAARKWEFKPTELGGAPVKVQGVLTFRFTLQ